MASSPLAPHERASTRFLSRIEVEGLIALLKRAGDPWFEVRCNEEGQLSLWLDGDGIGTVSLGGME